MRAILLFILISAAIVVSCTPSTGNENAKFVLLTFQRGMNADENRLLEQGKIFDTKRNCEKVKSNLNLPANQWAACTPAEALGK